MIALWCYWQWQPHDDELEAAAADFVTESGDSDDALRKFAGTADIDKAQIATLQHIPNWQCSNSILDFPDFCDR